MLLKLKNATLPPAGARNGAKRIPLGLVVAAAIFLQQNATANPIMVDLGTASGFSVLAYSGITDAGGASTITGNVGLSPTTGAAITGLTAGQVNGTIYAVDAAGPTGSANDPALLTTAKNDLSAAYTDANGRTATSLAGGDNQLGGQTLFAGVYSVAAASTANLIGTLTLDAQGNPNAVFIIQASSTLVTASYSSVVLINGAEACHVFWVVDSSATLGTYTDFMGNIMSYASIGLNTGATVDGELLAENGAVTLDANSIAIAVCNSTGGGTSVPDAGSTLSLLGFGVVGLLVFSQVRRGIKFSSAANIPNQRNREPSQVFID